MSICRITGPLLVAFALGCVPVAPSSNDVATPAFELPTPAQDIGQTAGAYGVSWTPLPGVAVTSVSDAPSTPFHGMACPSVDESSWDTSDPCMGEEDCDFVVLTAGCQLVELLQGELHVCMARAADGAWEMCEQALGIPDREIWPLIKDAYGYDGEFEMVPLPELRDCFRMDAVDDMPNSEISSAGIQFKMGGVDHVACANPGRPDSWGGFNPLGTVYWPVTESCIDPLIDLGWNVQYSEAHGGPIVQADSFSLEVAMRGQLADL